MCACVCKLRGKAGARERERQNRLAKIIHFARGAECATSGVTAPKEAEYDPAGQGAHEAAPAGEVCEEINSNVSNEKCFSFFLSPMIIVLRFAGQKHTDSKDEFMQSALC